MPFITQNHREKICTGELAPFEVQVGDLCYQYYKPMVDQWKDSPAWTTAHYIYKDVCLNIPEGNDRTLAKSLAWQVFFQLHVMPYELKKREENGDI